MGFIDFLKETNAYYNPSTNEIIGCKKGGFIYWHEYGHLLQFKNNPLFMILANFNTIGGMLLLYFVTGEELFYFWLIGFWVGVELSAYVYAFLKRFVLVGEKN